MCNPISIPSSPSPNSSKDDPQSNFYFDFPWLPSLKETESSEQQKKQSIIESPVIHGVTEEIKSLFRLASPIAATAIIMYFRSVISMAFLGRIGDAELAGGSLGIAFANISGYSVLAGLSLGMEPLCSQAFGAQRPKLLSLTLHRTVIFLLVLSIPISLLWLNVSAILILLRQDREISITAGTYLLFSLPDLVTNSFIHPIRIYLRAQRITHPLTFATLLGTILHLPFNFVLVTRLRLGVAGVAAAGAASNFLVLASLVAYVWGTGIHTPTWTAPSRECLTGWKPLIKLATPSCVSVCLEWWWYEIMILLCGLLVDPQSTVASMGILIQTTSFIYIFPSSLGFAASTLVGNQLGANSPKRAKVTTSVFISVAMAMGLSAMGFAYATRDQWGRFFSDDIDIRQMTAATLPILGLCELWNAPQTVACGVLRGTARPSTAANVNLSAFYLVGMPVAVGLGFGLGLGFRGLWMGLLAAQVCCAGLMLYVVATTDWEAQSERARALTGAGFDDEKQHLLSVAVG